MEIHILLAGEQLGPFSETQVRQYLGEGLVTPSDLAMYEGMDEWQPVDLLLAHLPPSAPAPETISLDAPPPEPPAPADVAPPPDRLAEDETQTQQNCHPADSSAGSDSFRPEKKPDRKNGAYPGTPAANGFAAPITEPMPSEKNARQDPDQAEAIVVQRFPLKTVAAPTQRRSGHAAHTLQRITAPAVAARAAPGTGNGKLPPRRLGSGEFHARSFTRAPGWRSSSFA